MTKAAINSKNILIIGSGTFIEETIFPALAILKEQYNIIGIVNKSGKLSDHIETHYPELKVSTTLLSFINHKIDVVFISTPQNVVPSILKQLIAIKLTSPTLLLTTPVLALKDIFKAKLLKSFKQAYAFEFVPLMKPYQMAKELIDEGKIGKPVKVWLNHSGYLYHGYAVVRKLLGKPELKNGKAIPYGEFNEYQLTFKKQYATITEPKNYAKGSFMIAGDKGIISDYLEGNDHQYQITCQTNNHGFLTGFAVNHKNKSLTIEESYFLEKISQLPLIDISLHKQLTLLAAYEMLSAIATNNSSLCYSWQNTIEDHLAMRIIKKLSKAHILILKLIFLIIPNKK